MEVESRARPSWNGVSLPDVLDGMVSLKSLFPREFYFYNDDKCSTPPVTTMPLMICLIYQRAARAIGRRRQFVLISRAIKEE
ncbi:uncharacterized [Tachysurus ichikawai]